MLDFAQARRTMVDSQLRTFDVNELRLLDAMDETPRERFVPRHLEGIAYIDQDLPLSDGEDCRYILSPMVQARLIQALAIDPGAKVLDVACGLGYSSAILAALGAKVVALEVEREPRRIRPPMPRRQRSSKREDCLRTARTGVCDRWTL